jgi:hypothetical protein
MVLVLPIKKSRSVLIYCGLYQGDESFDREFDDSNTPYLKQIDFPIGDLVIAQCR